MYIHGYFGDTFDGEIDGDIDGGIADDFGGDNIAFRLTQCLPR